MKKINLLLLLLSLLFVSSAASGVETLYMSHKPGDPVIVGASQGPLLPVKSPEFTIQLFPEHFEVTFKVPLLPGEKLRNEGNGDDDETMFRGDVAEFFISTDKKIYYQIAVNPAGLCYTARKRDTSWNPRIKKQISLLKDAWFARFSIPYKEINTERPHAKTIWFANFSATVLTGNQKKSCNWSNAQNFHNISEFGCIRFNDKSRPQLLYWDTDNDCFNALLHVPVKYASSKIVCRVGGKKYPGKRSGSYFRWRVPLFDSYVFPKRVTSVRITLTNREGKEIYSRRAAIEPHGFKTLDIDRFYYTKDQKELRYRHNFATKAQLQLKDAAGQIIARYPAAPEGKISLAGLTPGSYVLELAGGFQKTSRYFRIVPENFSPGTISPTARFEVKNGLFHLDNKPVFLIGGSGTPQKHLQFPLAFNMNTGNLGVIPNAVSFRGLGHTRFLRKPFLCSYLFPGADKIIDRRLSTVPADGRYVTRLAYEAQIQLASGDIKAPKKTDAAKYYAGLYKRLKKQHPEKYFSIHIDREEHLNSFVSSCDIFEFASWRSSYAANMIPDLPADMAKVRAKAGKRPLVFWLGGSIPNPRCRMAEELRAAVYCAIINRINGVIFHLGHGGLARERTRIWSLISGINAEVRELYQEFATGREIKDFVRHAEGRFLYSARQCGKNICLIVVNLEGSEQILEMETAAGNIKTLLTPFEPRVFRFPAK